MFKHLLRTALLLGLPLLAWLLVNNSFFTKPSAADFAVARNAMPISEVLLKIRGGSRKEEVLSEVLRRKIPTKIVPTTELELAAFGAGQRLIAAMKDANNILTDSQEQAYGELEATKQGKTPKSMWARLMSRIFGDPAPVQVVAYQPVNQDKVEQETELARRRQLSEANLRQIEQNQELQAAKEREQEASRPRFEAGRDRSEYYSTPSRYATPYATPYRRSR